MPRPQVKAHQSRVCRICGCTEYKRCRHVIQGKFFALFLLRSRWLSNEGSEETGEFHRENKFR